MCKTETIDIFEEKENKWSKKCPVCGEIMRYSRKDSLVSSIKKNTQCIICASKKRKPIKLTDLKIINDIIELHQKRISLKKIANKYEVNIKTMRQGKSLVKPFSRCGKAVPTTSAPTIKPKDLPRPFSK